MDDLCETGQHHPPHITMQQATKNVTDSGIELGDGMHCDGGLRSATRQKVWMHLR